MGLGMASENVKNESSRTSKQNVLQLPGIGFLRRDDLFLQTIPAIIFAIQT
jgi:hypothetical protein